MIYQHTSCKHKWNGKGGLTTCSKCGIERGSKRKDYPLFYESLNIPRPPVCKSRDGVSNYLSPKHDVQGKSCHDCKKSGGTCFNCDNKATMMLPACEKCATIFTKIKLMWDYRGKDDEWYALERKAREKKK